jgi:MoaA/NifB/PqqE/SkfB family radical SAM enzyme
MNTNAGAKSVAWWEELADVINKKGAVIFSVDGLRDTNHLYRQGVNWDNVERNMQAFINAGGRARWDFLIFEHNQHQIDEAEALATKWGCEKFMKKKTGRFITGKGEKKQSHQAVDKKGNNSTEIKQDVILNKYGSMDTYYDAAPIICKVKKDNSLFITAEGLALPCCWTAGRMYKWWHKDPKVEQIWDFIPNISALQARNGLEAVFDTGIFDSIQASWNKPSCGTGKLKVCAMKCGAEFDPFAEQFK